MKRWFKSPSIILTSGIEQEITGDVLLELDANVLKTEFGIAAFGKRIRIINAIAELRRPPSFSESDHPLPALSNSRSQSFNYGHSHSSSMASSAQQSYANSPLGYGFSAGHSFSPAPSQKAVGSSATLGSNGYGHPDSPPHMPMPDVPQSASSAGWRTSEFGAPFMPVSMSMPLPQHVASEVNLSTPRMSEAQQIAGQAEAAPQQGELVGLGLGLTSHSESRSGSPEKASVRQLLLGA